MADETLDAADWHYVITLQVGAVPPFLFSTQHGLFGGYTDEDDAFTSVWDTACRRLTEKTGKPIDRENSAVLLYRLERALR